MPCGRGRVGGVGIVLEYRRVDVLYEQRVERRQSSRETSCNITQNLALSHRLENHANDGRGICENKSICSIKRVATACAACAC